MGPKHKQSTPSKTLLSPLHKKQCTDSMMEVGGQTPNVNKGASSKNLAELFGKPSQGAHEMDEPPEWFVNYEHRLNQTLNHRFKAVTDPLEEIKEKFKAVDFEIDTLKTDVKSLQKENNDLRAKIDDIENRSRRSNLVFYGIPEHKDGQEDCFKTINELLQGFVGVDINPEHIDRCHRTPTHRTPGQSKPRIIHVAFSSFQTREIVRKACIVKFKDNLLDGRKAYVSEDFSKRVQMVRKAKMEVFRRLQQQGKKPFFVYPDTIKYKDDGKVLTYNPEK